MKNLVIQCTFILFAFTICSFQTPNPTVQEIFQEALNIEALADHLAKDDNGETLPIIMATNGLLSEDLSLSLDGKVVSMVNTNIDTESETSSVLDLKEIKMKGKKSILAFQYREKTIKIRLKKEAGDWVAKMITVKWKNGFNTKIVSSSSEHF